MSNLSRTVLTACLPATLALLAVACDIQVNNGGLSLDIAEGRARDQWTRSYTVAPDGRFELEGGNGDIHVVPATGGEVVVVADREVRARTDEEAAARMKQMKMEEQVSPQLVRVSLVRAADGEPRDRVRIDYRVSVPPRTSATFATRNGNIRIENVEGRLRAESANGSIEGHGISGEAEASTVNGGITMEMAAVSGDVRLTTVNGGIRLDLPANVKATLEAETVNGGVSVAERLPLSGPARERQRVSGDLNGGGGPAIRVQTTNGGIRVGVQGSGDAVTTDGARAR
jgi:hypothetical protein